jgi:hypothetical protein
MNQLMKYFGVVYQGLRGQLLRDRVDLGSLIRYGRFRLAGDGDSIRTAALIDHDPTVRDNSYVKVRVLFVCLFIHYVVLTYPLFTSTTFYRTAMPPIETELTPRTGELNMADYVKFIEE